MTTEQHEHWLQKVKVAAPLDAALMLHYYNSKAKYRDSQSVPPDIELTEVLPSLSAQDAQEAYKRAEKLMQCSTNLGLAFYEYPAAARTYEEELLWVKNENPGFSDGSYEFVASLGMLDMR